MVSTLDFESNNPSSILGMSYFFVLLLLTFWREQVVILQQMADEPAMFRFSRHDEWAEKLNHYLE